MLNYHRLEWINLDQLPTEIINRENQTYHTIKLEGKDLNYSKKSVLSFPKNYVREQIQTRQTDSK